MRESVMVCCICSRMFNPILSESEEVCVRVRRCVCG